MLFRSQCGVGQLEITNHAVSQGELVRRENELIRPSFELFQSLVGTYCRLDSSHHRRAYGTDTFSCGFRFIDRIAGFPRNEHLFRIHLMFGQVLDIDVPEIT